MGRPRKPTALLKLAGDYRKDRHGDRASEPRPNGAPIMPDNLPSAAQEFWRRNVPGLVRTGVATAADQDALVRMAFWWAVLTELSDILSIPQESRPRKWVQELSIAEKHWRDLAAKFGMTPVDRAKLSVAPREEYNPAAEFVR